MRFLICLKDMTAPPEIARGNRLCTKNDLYSRFSVQNFHKFWLLRGPGGWMEEFGTTLLANVDAK